MIKKILERLEAKRTEAEAMSKKTHTDKVTCLAWKYAMEKAIEIVQEVAKEYGNGWIPVEIELPTEEGLYLCTVLHANKCNPWIMRFKNGEFLRPDDVEGLDYKILAWQRITPYQKEEPHEHK